MVALLQLASGGSAESDFVDVDGEALGGERHGVGGFDDDDVVGELCRRRDWGARGKPREGQQSRELGGDSACEDAVGGRQGSAFGWQRLVPPYAAWLRAATISELARARKLAQVEKSATGFGKFLQVAFGFEALAKGIEIEFEVPAFAECVHQGRGFFEQFNRSLVAPVADTRDSLFGEPEIDGDGVFGMRCFALRCEFEPESIMAATRLSFAPCFVDVALVEKNFDEERMTCQAAPAVLRGGDGVLLGTGLFREAAADVSQGAVSPVVPVVCCAGEVFEQFVADQSWGFAEVGPEDAQRIGVALGAAIFLGHELPQSRAVTTGVEGHAAFGPFESLLMLSGGAIGVGDAEVLRGAGKIAFEDGDKLLDVAGLAGEGFHDAGDAVEALLAGVASAACSCRNVRPFFESGFAERRETRVPEQMGILSCGIVPLAEPAVLFEREQPTAQRYRIRPSLPAGLQMQIGEAPDEFGSLAVRIVDVFERDVQPLAGGLAQVDCCPGLPPPQECFEFIQCGMDASSVCARLAILNIVANPDRILKLLSYLIDECGRVAPETGNCSKPLTHSPILLRPIHEQVDERVLIFRT